MKHDIGRLSFDELNHFVGVFHQMGRLPLESDFNEQNELVLRLLQRLAGDAIHTGSPNEGFRIGTRVLLDKLESRRAWSATPAAATLFVDYFDHRVGDGSLVVLGASEIRRALEAPLDLSGVVDVLVAVKAVPAAGLAFYVEDGTARHVFAMSDVTTDDGWLLVRGVPGAWPAGFAVQRIVAFGFTGLSAAVRYSLDFLEADLPLRSPLVRTELGERYAAQPATAALVADDDRVVPRTDLEQVPRPDLDHPSVRHLDPIPAGKHEPEVRHLADRLAGGCPDVLRPPPAGRVLGASDGHAADLDEVEDAERELTVLVGLAKSADDSSGLGHRWISLLRGGPYTGQDRSARPARRRRARGRAPDLADAADARERAPDPLPHRPLDLEANDADGRRLEGLAARVRLVGAPGRGPVPPSRRGAPQRPGPPAGAAPGGDRGRRERVAGAPRARCSAFEVHIELALAARQPPDDVHQCVRTERFQHERVASESERPLTVAPVRSGPGREHDQRGGKGHGHDEPAANGVGAVDRFARVGCELRVIPSGPDRVEQIREGGAPRIEPHGRLLGCVVHRRLDAVELVQLALDAVRTRRARHALEGEIDPRLRLTCRRRAHAAS